MIYKTLYYVINLLLFLRYSKVESAEDVGNSDSNWLGRGEIPENVQKIVGGENAPVDAYPWFVRLVKRDGSWWGCGAMLVAPEIVLTAAHCFSSSDDASNLAAQIGAVCPYQDDNCGAEEETINASSLILHPDFSTATLDNDYALIKLASNATKADPVTMDQGQYVVNYSSTKRNLYSIGFGSLYSGGPVSNELLHVELAYIPSTTCNDNYSGLITSNMMCASDPGQDSCQGDSGGPLYDADNDVLVGIVSWGYSCAYPSYPGVYAQVSSGWQWIQVNICSHHTSPKPDFCAGVTAPPTASPTAAPTHTPCSNDELDVVISITTDKYPSEISWTISSQSGETISSETMTETDKLYSTGLCLDSSICHTFTINDSWGDGIIDEGDFSVTVDGNVILSDIYQGWNTLSVDFGQCASSCSNDEHTVEVSITTDNYPYEISWTISSQSGETISSETMTEPGKLYSTGLCLDSSICHTFTINDSWGDGIIDEGDFSVTVDGSEVLSDLSQGWNTLSVDFGQCNSPSDPTPSPTAAPTPSPTTAPTPSPTTAPTPSPTTAPTSPSPTAAPTSPSPISSSVCEDFPLKFRVFLNGRNRFRTCAWVKKNSNRCNVAGVNGMCSNTCNTCNICQDSNTKFKVYLNGKFRGKTCTWVKKKRNLRCAIEGVQEACRSTCGQC